MRRIEIIISQAIDEEFTTLCEEKKVATHFTKIPNVLGRGNSNPKMGDSVWPQFNNLYIIYCKKKEAKKIEEIIDSLRKDHSEEGIACFTGN